MTEQEVFDTVVDHLRKQNYERSVNDNDRCMYQGNDGLKCAVGCLIPDELYDPNLEAKDALQVCHILGSKWPPAQHADLLHALQITHDRHMNKPEYAERSLSMVAKDFGLTYTPPTQGELA